MKSNMARIMLAAPASGSGKTMLTCGLLAAFKKRQLHIAALSAVTEKIISLCDNEMRS